MRGHVTAIFQKQWRDTLKNKAVLIQFVMFPMMTIIMTNAVKIEDMPKNFFVFLFAAMYVGMAPLTVISAIMSEEKEKGILRILQLMNVKPGEYMMGTGSYVFLLCLICSFVFPLCGDYTARETCGFMAVMAVGISISVLIGGAIGNLTDNQMAATSVTVPVMMIFSFLPMLSMFNKTVEKVSKFTYSGQIHKMLSNISEFQWKAENIVILAMNMVIALAVFIMAYQKAQKDGD